jgi:hypothetical protein
MRRFVSSPPAVTTFTAEVADREAGEGRRRRGLEDHRVSGGETGRDLDERDAEREVPRRHDRDDAERLEAVRAGLVGEEDLRVVDRALGEDGGGVPREIPERVRRRDDVHGAGLSDRFPLLGRDEARDLLVRFPDLLEEAREVLLPGGYRRLRPGEERLPGGGDGGVDLGRTGADDVRERLARRRVHGLEGDARVDVLAVDDRLVGERALLHGRVLGSFIRSSRRA